MHLSLFTTLSLPSDLIAPFYKGLVHLPDRESLALITKRDPVANTVLSNDAYLHMIGRWLMRSPELIQNVVRAGVASLLAVQLRQQGATPRLVSVDGCSQVVGGRAMGGAQIVENIWRQVIPRELMVAAPSPLIENVSDCTVAEARTIVKHARKTHSRIHAITHDYHMHRVRRTLHEAAGSSDGIRVYTPEDIVQVANTEHPEARLIVDLVRVGTIAEGTVRRERLLETFAYGPLHLISRSIDCASRGRISIEEWIAHKLRTPYRRQPVYNNRQRL